MYAGVPNASFTGSGAMRPDGVMPSVPNASLMLAVRGALRDAEVDDLHDARAREAGRCSASRRDARRRARGCARARRTMPSAIGERGLRLSSEAPLLRRATCCERRPFDVLEHEVRPPRRACALDVEEEHDVRVREIARGSSPRDRAARRTTTSARSASSAPSARRRARAAPAPPCRWSRARPSRAPRRSR